MKTSEVEMEDVLSVLRRYNVQKKEIVTDGDTVVFGELSWPKSAETGFAVSGSGKKGLKPKEHYTLDSVLFLLANSRLPHNSYAQRATAQGVPVVRKPDRKAMLSYLNGGSGSTPTGIDGGSSLPVETKRKRAADEVAASPAVKRPRVEDEEQGTRPDWEAHQEEDSERYGSLPGAAMTTSAESECSSVETDRDDSPFDSRTLADGGSLVEKARSEVDGTLKEECISVDAEEKEKEEDVMVVDDDIASRERVWSSRNSVLQSSGQKDFSRSVLAVLQSVRDQEERRRSTGRALQMQGLDVGVYRHTTSTPSAAAAGASSGDNSTLPTPSSPQPVSRLAPSQATPSHPSHSQNVRASSRTPIVVVPAGTTSLITLANARELLEELTFVTSEEKRRRKSQGGSGGSGGLPPRDQEVLLQRRKEQRPGTDGASRQVTVPYRLTDQPSRLSPEDWQQRVVCVFVQGPAWQFKGCPGVAAGGSPADLFARVPAFHLKYDDAPTDANVRRWDNVTLLEVSRHRRHLDRPVFLRFWEALDRHMTKHKEHLHF